MTAYRNLVDPFWSALPDVCRRHPEVEAVIEDDEGMVFIASISSSDPGKGHGTSFMLDLLALSDEHQLDVSLDPSEEAGDRLVSWYERLGFYFENSQRMVRSAEYAPSMHL